MSIGRIIETDACVAEGADWLARRTPAFARILPVCAPLPLRRSPAGFGALFSAIVGQQVSTASAAAIWARLDAANLTDEDRVASATDDDLRGCGLSRPKVRYAKALATAKLDWGGLADLPNDQVIDHLTGIIGIGRWTAEIYAMFALGRADVIAAGDLALQESARMVFDLPAGPSEKELRAMSADWSPWAAVAARLLWAYYRVAKQRDGIL